MENNYRILIAEDEPKLSQVIQEELIRQGYQAEVAYDGAVAEKLFKQHSYSVVLLDINLPYKNGLALCKEFRQQNGTVPIIILYPMLIPFVKAWLQGVFLIHEKHDVQSSSATEKLFLTGRAYY